MGVEFVAHISHTQSGSHNSGDKSLVTILSLWRTVGNSCPLSISVVTY